MSSPHVWKFFRTGGLAQVALETGADLLALPQLNQKLWVALSCPVKRLSLDEKTLAEAKVITVKKDFNLVVVDVGKNQGLLIGTPVKIHRKDRVVGSAIVIDVRDAVSGAIILEMNDPNDNIMVDDAVKVDPKGV